MNARRLIACMAVGVAGMTWNGRAQSVEAYAGDKRAGVDIMWFRYFKDGKERQTPFLFFSRNRAGTGYENPAVAFGSTNAVSYNFPNGIGLVAVGTFLNAGFKPKTGIQYHRQKGDFMFFGWLVADLKRQGNLDLFGMARITPPISGKTRLFVQTELFPVYKPSSGSWNVTERIRLGLKQGMWSGGLMCDLNQTGKTSWNNTGNLGLFIRQDFK